MNLKKKIAAAIGIILLLGLIVFTAVKNNELILQGEVDTTEIDLASKITGRVKEIYVKEGDIVEKGEPLILLDTPDIKAKHGQAEAALETARAKKLEIDNGTRSEKIRIAQNSLRQAEAGLELAQKEYDRIKDLSEDGAVSVQKFDEVKAQYTNALKARNIAEENLEMAQTGARYEEKLQINASVKQAQNLQNEMKSYLDENIIKSPVKGQVKDIAVEEGELAGSGYTIVTIVDTTDNWIVLNLREDLLSKIHIGSEFDVKIPAVSKKPIKVRVYYISAMGDYTTWRATKIRGDFDLKTFEVRARPVQPVKGMIAGMSVLVDWNKVKQ